MSVPRCATTRPVSPGSMEQLQQNASIIHLFSSFQGSNACRVLKGGGVQGEGVTGEP